MTTQKRDFLVIGGAIAKGLEEAGFLTPEDRQKVLRLMATERISLVQALEKEKLMPPVELYFQIFMSLSRSR